MNFSEGREVSYFDKFIGHISSIGFINSIYISVWCCVCLWSECCIYYMASYFLWWIFTIDIVAKFTDGTKIFTCNKFISGISLLIREDSIYFPIWRDMFTWIIIGKYPWWGRISIEMAISWILCINVPSKSITICKVTYDFKYWWSISYFCSIISYSIFFTIGSNPCSCVYCSWSIDAKFWIYKIL